MTIEAQPTPRHQPLGHIDAPPLVPFGGFAFTPLGRRLRFLPQVGRDQEMMLPHQAPNPLLFDRPALDRAPVGLNPEVALEGILRLQRLDPRQQLFIVLDDPQRLLPLHASRSSLIFTPMRARRRAA
jgi:hypothetical protein